MTALECLRQHKEAPAEFIAEKTGLPLEQVYTELVAAEAEGRARVVCGGWIAGAGYYRAWEAM